MAFCLSNSSLKRLAYNLKVLLRLLGALFFHLHLNIPVEREHLKMCIIHLAIIEVSC